jgi:cytochrome c biogenesis protein CcmG, thiol:disulfide interchange protein DsbE
MRRARAALLALLLTGLVAGCSSGGADDGGSSPRTDVASVETDLQPCPAQTGQPAAGSGVPQVRLDCFGGGSLDFRKASGVPTVVNLWASWCGPCREELPLVQQLALAAGDRVRVLTVDSQDGIPQATSFAADAGVTLPTTYDGQGQVAADLGLRGLPQTVFLAPDGSVAFVQPSAVTSLEEFESLVAQHLGVQL